MLNISTQKVGGLRFVRIGRLCVSFCLTRKPAPKAQPAPVRVYARPAIKRAPDGRWFAIARLYANGKFAGHMAAPFSFPTAVEADAHVLRAVTSCGLTLAR